jgi:hypothetical protein
MKLGESSGHSAARSKNLKTKGAEAVTATERARNMTKLFVALFPPGIES